MSKLTIIKKIKIIKVLPIISKIQIRIIIREKKLSIEIQPLIENIFLMTIMKDPIDLRENTIKEDFLQKKTMKRDLLIMIKEMNKEVTVEEMISEENQEAAIEALIIDTKETLIEEIKKGAGGIVKEILINKKEMKEGQGDKEDHIRKISTEAQEMIVKEDLIKELGILIK